MTAPNTNTAPAVDTAPAAHKAKAAAEERVLERFLEKRAAKQAARDEKGQQYRTYLRWSGKALEIPLSVVVGLLLGMYLEKQLDFAPWGTWGGLFFGVAAAVRAMYRLVKVYQRENPDEPDTNDGSAS